MPKTRLAPQSAASTTREDRPKSTLPTLADREKNRQSKRATELSQDAPKVDVQNISAVTSHTDHLAVEKRKVSLQPTLSNGDTARRVAVAVKIPARATVATAVRRPTTPRSKNSVAEQSSNEVASRCTAKEAPSAFVAASSSKGQLAKAQVPDRDTADHGFALANASNATAVTQPPIASSCTKDIRTGTPDIVSALLKIGKESPKTPPTELSVIRRSSTGYKEANSNITLVPIQPAKDSREDAACDKAQVRAAQEGVKECTKLTDKHVGHVSNCQSRTVPELSTALPKVPSNIDFPKKLVSKVPESAMRLPKPAIFEHKPHADDAPATPAPLILLPRATALTADTVPYFEYSIFQKIWSRDQIEASVPATEILSRPYTNVDEANEQAEKLFNNAREQYRAFFQVQFDEWNSKRDDHDCETLTGTFAPIDYPSRKSWIRIWVQRDYVSEYAGGKETSMKQHTSFVAKTIYVLRLFELIVSSAEANREDDATTVAATRVYHPLPRTECYTTLEAANRAAKTLQIELSHEREATAMAKVWQATNLAKLDKKFRDLQEAVDQEGKYWKSEFNGCGLGSTRFELVVEKVGLCGPRNL
jgi:hypothetical protein